MINSNLGHISHRFRYGYL